MSVVFLLLAVGIALRKESVDRNSVPFRPASHLSMSLSARRAWIEMTYVTRLPRAQVSLSARRAWIEISRVWRGMEFPGCRSPQGERG